ncbi:MAG: hypothetical protein OJJ54_00535 [Pseudonocardia sp.]|nr:hypothetical protein [Pseudonocardia sp.]
MFKDDILVNAELARAGLGVPVVFDGNDRFLPDVEEAAAEAKAQKRGLYSPVIACTLPARVATTEARAATAPAASAVPASATSATLAQAAGTAGSIAADAGAYLGRSGGVRGGLVWAAYEKDEQDGFVDRMAEAVGTARSAESALQDRATATKHDEDQVAKAAEEQRRVHEASARQREVEARAARQREADAAAAERRRTSTSSAGGSSSNTGSAGGSTPKPPTVAPAPAPDAYPGYTGPRCYAPGGKTWKPC